VRVLLTRPERDSRRFAEQFATPGIETLFEPMLTIEYEVSPLDLSSYQAILLTSRYGARGLARATEQRGVPILTVGSATAATAEEEGFTRVRSARGDAAVLAQFTKSVLDSGDGPVLFVHGQDTTGDLKSALETAGFAVDESVLYAAHAAEKLSSETVSALDEGSVDGVLLFSPRTARTFVSLVAMADLSHRTVNIDAYCLSDAVAEAALGLAWRRILVASRPEADALIALLSGPGIA
jgi:uroporphyrinogen-III synthase